MKKYFFITLFLFVSFNLFAQEVPLTGYQDKGKAFATLEGDTKLKVYNKKGELTFFHTFEQKQNAKLIKLSASGEKVFFLGKNAEVNLFDLATMQMSQTGLKVPGTATAMTMVKKNVFLVGTDQGVVYEAIFDAKNGVFLDEVGAVYKASGESIKTLKISSDGRFLYINHAFDSGNKIGFTYTTELPGDVIGKAGPLGFKPNLTPPTGLTGPLGFGRSFEPVVDEELLKLQQENVEIMNSSPRGQKGVFIHVDAEGNYKMVLKMSDFSAIQMTDDFADVYYASKIGTGELNHLNLNQIVAAPEADIAPALVMEKKADFIQVKGNIVYAADADAKVLYKMSTQTQKITEIPLSSEVRQIIKHQNSIWVVLENGELQNLENPGSRSLNLGHKLTRDVKLVQAGDEFFLTDSRGNKIGVTLNLNCAVNLQP